MTGPHPDPILLEQALADAGFARIGGRAGACSRWEWPEADRRTASLIVPLDPTAGDHADLIRALMLELTAMANAGNRASNVLQHTLSQPAPSGTRPRQRLKACVERWPGAEIDGDYDPRCRRFPKSCSASVYDNDQVTDGDLEPA